MANTHPQHGNPKATTSQQQAGVSPPQGQFGGLGYQASQGGQTPQGGGVADRVAQTAERQAQRAIERVEHTRAEALGKLESQQAQIGERIRDISGALRSSSIQLGHNETAASLLNAAGDQVERLASYVDTATPRSVASDLHNFARDRPAWFFGGAFLVGLALGRFAKSSAEAASSVSRSPEGNTLHHDQAASAFASRPTGGSGYAERGAAERGAAERGAAERGVQATRSVSVGATPSSPTRDGLSGSNGNGGESAAPTTGSASTASTVQTRPRTSTTREPSNE